MKKQQGYFLILAVVLIFVIGAMGLVIAYSLSNRAKTSVNVYNGMSAFYLAESGLDVAARMLVGTGITNVACSALTGNASVTDAPLLNGTFTATAVGGGLYSASTTLSGSITATSNSLTLNSTTGFAPHGRVRIDSEAIDYASISGSSLVGLNRGVSSTTAASHTSGATVAQNVCLVDVQAGIPSIASPQYQRELQMAVEITGSSDAWAVGNRNGNRFAIARWNTPTANIWNDYSVTDVSNRANLNAISMASSNYGWATGDVNGSDFEFVNWSGGSSWSVVPVAGACSGQHLEGISTISTTQAWAVGLRYRPGCASGGNYRYTILRYNGSSWSLLTPFTSPSIPSDSSSNQNLNAISMVDATGTGNATFGFAVGAAGVTLKFNGTNWVSVASGSSAALNGVDVVSANEAWAVGSGGVILKWNGSGWSSFTSPTTRTLQAISMVDTNNDGRAEVGWASGASGTIIYYNGTSFSTQTSGVSSSTLNAIGAFSSSIAFAGGTRSTVLQWTGSSWTADTSALSATFQGITVTSSSGMTATGTQVGSWQQTFN